MRADQPVPVRGDFYVRGADVVQDQGDTELVFLDVAGPELIGMASGAYQLALERRARFLAAEAGTRAWRAGSDGTFTALPTWTAAEPTDVH